MSEESKQQGASGLSHLECDQITEWALGEGELSKPYCTISADSNGYPYYALTCFRDGNLVQYRARSMTEMQRTVQSKAGLIYRLNYEAKAEGMLPSMQSGIDLTKFIALRRERAAEKKKRAVQEITEALSEVGIVTFISDHNDDQ